MPYDDDPKPVAAPVVIPAAKDPASPPKRRRFGRGARFWFVLALIGCIVVFGGRYAFRHFRSTSELASALAARDHEEPGWRLADLEGGRTALADADNSALHVEEADGLLPKKRTVLYILSGPDGPIVPGGLPVRPLTIPEQNDFRARLLELPPNERLSAEDLSLLRQEFRPVHEALEKARELADLPNGRFTVEHKRNPLTTLFPHIGKARNLIFWLCFDAIRRSEDGDGKGALRSCRAALNAARSLGDEPFAISQLVRCDGVRQACSAIERVLGQCEVDADDLHSLQKLLEDEAAWPRLLALVRGERAALHEFLDAVESGAVPFADINRLNGMGSLPSRPLFSMDEVRVEHQDLLRIATEAVEIAKLPPHQRTKRIDAYEINVRGVTPRLVISPFLYNLRGMDDNARSTDARLQCLIAALAVERYRLHHNNWPASMRDVTPELLSELPLDPADGEPIAFEHDGADAVFSSRLQLPKGPFAAVSDPDKSLTPPPGVVVRLFDVPHRRLPSPPKPAGDLDIDGPR
jgi:hypothetical protein